MRRRWPVLAVTIPMALGGAVATAYPAAGMVMPQVSGGRSQAAPGAMSQVVSSNWAGYAASGGNGTFTSASASWTQPAGMCTRGGTYAAFWVGLDGYTSRTVEQIGTEVDCAGRTPLYHGWYETYPAGAVNFPEPVRPGDQFSGSVTYRGHDTFQLVLRDVTGQWTQTRRVTVTGAARSSAEVVAEAPSDGRRTLPLTDFGTAGFTAVRADSKSLATFGPDEITMPRTAVSALTGAGNFRVTYTGFASRPWWPARS